MRWSGPWWPRLLGASNFFYLPRIVCRSRVHTVIARFRCESLLRPLTRPLLASATLLLLSLTGEGSAWANQTLSMARQIHDMIVLAQAILRGARERDECRGAHYKPEFELKIPEGKFPGDPEFEEYRRKWKENNDNWLKTTIAEHAPDGPKISYEDVDTTVVPPEQPRDYR